VILEITMLVAISPLLVLGCVMPASAKLAGAPAVRESAAHSGIPWNRYRLIRVLGRRVRDADTAGKRPGRTVQRGMKS
jgi:hypothetical protein